MDSYDKVAKVVAPKRAALAEAEAAYNEVMTALRAKQVSADRQGPPVHARCNWLARVLGWHQAGAAAPPGGG